MNEELKKQMREILLERYGVDIDEAVFRFSTQNYAFIFPDKPFMIRVSMSPTKTRKEILSELMWVDDLKRVKQTICEPSPSLQGNILEEFEINQTTYRASMFRKARGNMKATTDMNPMFFICAGDLLGTIHHVSTDEREIGMKYGRKILSEDIEAIRKRVWKDVPEEMKGRILEIEEQVHALPQDVGRYGLCHGDFNINNFLVDENNIWLFDFDNCTYADYRYDITSFIQACLLVGYKPGEDCRKVLYEDILPYFKIGYTLNKECSDDYWEHLELFLSYNAMVAYLMLFELKVCGVVDDLDKIRQFFGYIVSQPDILAGLTMARGMLQQSENAAEAD